MVLTSSPSSTYTPLRIRRFSSSSTSSSSKHHGLRLQRFSLRVIANQTIEDGSTEQFLQNSISIADFMRFKKGRVKGSGELQTAVVSYRKKFPWSLLWPFLQVMAIILISWVFFCFFCFGEGGLFSHKNIMPFALPALVLAMQVDLVSTIHIADKEYVTFLFAPSFCCSCYVVLILRCYMLELQE